MENEIDDEEEEENNSTTHKKIEYSSQLQKKFQAMTKALCEVVNDYALVSFYPMNVNDVTVSFGCLELLFSSLCILCSCFGAQ